MATLDVGRTVTTKKDHPMMSEVALTICRFGRQAAIYSVRHSRKTQASRKAKWRRGPLSPPGQTSPTVSRPRETRPVAAMPGPVASGNSRPGRFDPPNSPADDPTTDGLVTGPRIGASLPRNLRTSGLVNV